MYVGRILIPEERLQQGGLVTEAPQGSAGLQSRDRGSAPQQEGWLVAEARYYSFVIMFEGLGHKGAIYNGVVFPYANSISTEDETEQPNVNVT